LENQVEFHPNLDRSAKVEFLRSLSVFSVPSRHGEAFGLYVIEAMAAGVPVVQPRIGAFIELVEMTGGGILCEPGNPESLADGIEAVLSKPDQGKSLGEAGKRAVNEKFNAQAMANGMIDLCKAAIGRSPAKI
jgi:glycosyltransferase involved in cell wall biosynthesis